MALGFPEHVAPVSDLTPLAPSPINGEGEQQAGAVVGCSGQRTAVK